MLHILKCLWLNLLLSFLLHVYPTLWNCCAWFRYLTLQEQVYMQTSLTLSLDGKTFRNLLATDL